MMLRTIEVHASLSLEDYAANAFLAHAVDELRRTAAPLVRSLDGRTVWMVNSTDRGGGVAEMLPRVVTLLRELGVRTEWLVLSTDKPEFFRFTKKLHNLIHGAGDANIDAAEREAYDGISEDFASELRARVAPDDLIVAHDPQPLAAVAKCRTGQRLGAVWRCHIGLDQTTTETTAAWEFLKPYLLHYDRWVFSAFEYVPTYLPRRQVELIHPALDPLGHKNRELHPIKLSGILCNAGLASNGEVLTPPFRHRVRRLHPDGSFGSALDPDQPSLLFRPVVTQVSRWDRLKGWFELLQGFVQLKQNHARGAYALDARDRRRLDLVRLLLAGPEPHAVQDDPEAQAVLKELTERYCALPKHVQRDVFVLSLPMHSAKHNALIVNALQRASSLIVQNSLQEGFGLVVTEGMWKRTPVLGSVACGIRQQIRPGVDGCLIAEPTNPNSVEAALVSTLGDVRAREVQARNAQRRVFSEFLIFRQLQRWLEVLSAMVETQAPSV